jgi:hypothetical protein
VLGTRDLGAQSVAADALAIHRSYLPFHINSLVVACRPQLAERLSAS